MDEPCRKPVCRITGEELVGLSAEISATYRDRVGVNCVERGNLPRRPEIVGIIRMLLELICPGYDGEFWTEADENARIEERLERCGHALCDQITRALRHGSPAGVSDADIAERACGATRKMLFALPEIRELLKLDVAAAYAGDPAAKNYDEIILSYPGIRAITIQRLAHILYGDKIPLIPRMMTEHAHSETGIDIHPGAQLGKGLFIDHGTGVIIGETAIVGDNVRIYQGVTLGAMSFPKDACGMLIKGKKRHPTIGSDVTIYAGAAVLGDIEIGAGAVVGGNVWVTESLPPGTKITSRLPETSRRAGAPHV